MAGLYVWHCHIVEHEDNEMMRPYEVVLAPANVMFGPEDVLLRQQMAKIAVLAFDKHTGDTLTRIQMLRILVRAAGSFLAQPPAGNSHGFTDVPPRRRRASGKGEVQ